MNVLRWLVLMLCFMLSTSLWGSQDDHPLQQRTWHPVRAHEGEERSGGRSTGRSTIEPPQLLSDMDSVSYTMFTDGIRVTMSHPQGLTILYSVSPSPDPDCNFQGQRVGQEYSGPFEVCIDPPLSVVRAVACDFTSDVQSSVAELKLSTSQVHPPLPNRPILHTLQPGSCSLKDGLEECSIPRGAEELKLLVMTTDFECNNAKFVTALDCEQNEFQWVPMRQCETASTLRPCIEIFYTTDGSDPTNSSSRKIYDISMGISLREGRAEVRAVTLRDRRRYDEQTCRCCCSATSCSVAGPVATKILEVKLSPQSRNPLLGSPDVRFLVGTPFAVFESQYYSERLRWRTKAADALGLFNQEMGDWRRIKGVCICSQEVGCLDPGIALGNSMESALGSEICFHAREGGNKTEVSFFITSAGMCTSGSSRDTCISNSSCGMSGLCDLKPTSWLLAYARLQNRDKETMDKLRLMDVEQAEVTEHLDLSAVEQELGLANNSVLSLASFFAALLLVSACVYAGRRWWRTKCLNLGPAIRSRGRAVVASVSRSREQKRLKRHAQFTRMQESAEMLSQHSASESTEDGYPVGEENGSSSLWATKKLLGFKKTSALLPPFPSYLTTEVLAQPMGIASLSPASAEEEDEGGGDIENGWGDFSEPLRRELVGSVKDVMVEVEYDGEAVSLRHHTLEQRLFFTNRSETTVFEFSCKAAVPKYMQVQITPPTNSTIAPGGEVNQTLRIAGVDKTKPIKVRLKVEFTGSEGAVGETIDMHLT
ncbi:Adaptor protein complex 1 subunit gamma 2 [Guillardia theta CCMP2712]|uniref:Adaptor protein complex 1 subunit gamma 2 n=2 Tax=Guillardia theta TaxID=55529 RepID=L1IWV6_GUITC|nr:Adaptor protein complex 1 subunit gamma 2 [Guillardia theta CCMP2712]EKX40597.1 Adaptor protein complex 1 subunit gamma 2 [Guillardia theta CCMP2712]|mmetsp:Transcript_49813/g.155894  ORF Transcript_49813/g.155894 Transcript_49813/m.155894 type:complete len:766 (+) Transcript_49813:187-2484(+)|eukprot:XP_005827577.1 Adaptor protein complex 1 subunit gamma 2 [Guillardia theta CCMP2712]